MEILSSVSAKYNCLLCCIHICKVKEEFHRLNAGDISTRKPTKDKGAPSQEEKNTNKQKKGRGWIVCLFFEV